MLFRFYFFIIIYFILFFNFTILYWFCHISTWIRHRYTRVPHLEPSSLLPPHTIPLGRPSVPAPSIQYRASNLDWRLISYMIFYMFQCHSPKSSHPLPLPQSPKDCSIHQCLFCCLVYRVIVAIFLNSIYIDSILKSRDITLLKKVRLVKAMVFPVVIYGCESWSVKKAEHRWIEAFEMWC